MDKKYYLLCDRPDGTCGHFGLPIIKMGGLICSKCRYVLTLPDKFEYTAYLKEMREKIEKST